MQTAAVAETSLLAVGRMRARGPFQPRQICEGGSLRHREAGPGPGDYRRLGWCRFDGGDGARDAGAGRAAAGSAR